MLFMGNWGDWYWGAYWMSWLMWLIPILIYWGVGIILAIWVYKDAKKRKGMPANMWLIIVLLTSVVGLIVYLIIREQ